MVLAIRCRDGTPVPDVSDAGEKMNLVDEVAGRQEVWGRGRTATTQAVHSGTYTSKKQVAMALRRVTEGEGVWRYCPGGQALTVHKFARIIGAGLALIYALENLVVAAGLAECGPDGRGQGGSGRAPPAGHQLGQQWLLAMFPCALCW
jgi:hypothetical protein